MECINITNNVWHIFCMTKYVFLLEPLSMHNFNDPTHAIGKSFLEITCCKLMALGAEFFC